MLEKIASLDERLFLYLNNLGNPTWDPFWLQYTDKITHLPLMLVLLFLIYRQLGLKQFGVAIILIALMSLVTDQFTNLVKHTFERPRPCRVPELENYMRYIAVRCGRFGYFSGHSSNSMALAIFFGSFLKKKYHWILLALIIWSLGMGYSRIYVGVHYPADLLSGFTLGILTGTLFYKLHGYLVQKLGITLN